MLGADVVVGDLTRPADVAMALDHEFMQNVGVVNDHVHGCFRATD
jgi:3-methyladenine DNA glycosylase Tag